MCMYNHSITHQVKKYSLHLPETLVYIYFCFGEWSYKFWQLYINRKYTKGNTQTSQTHSNVEESVKIKTVSQGLNLVYKYVSCQYVEFVDYVFLSPIYCMDHYFKTNTLKNKQAAKKKQKQNKTPPPKNTYIYIQANCG